MRHQYDLTAQVLAGQLIDRAGNAFAQVNQALTPRRGKVGVALAPQARFFGVVCMNLRVGFAFKQAKPPLAQPLGGNHFAGA